jgi:hypothetical protein
MHPALITARVNSSTIEGRGYIYLSSRDMMHTLVGFCGDSLFDYGLGRAL